VVVSGHTHQAYVCEIDGRLVTSGDKYGTIVTAIDLTLDRASRDVISAKASNTIVRTASYAKKPRTDRAAESYDKVAAPIANRPAGTITETLSRLPNNAAKPARRYHRRCAARRDQPCCERRRGDRLHHPGGIRIDIAHRQEGAVTYADLFASQPFRKPAGDADAERKADQGHARAAMARSEAAADPAGLEGLYVCMGQQQSERRAHLLERMS